MSQPLLEIDGASVMRGGALAAGGTLALDNLSFVVRAGEHVALLGPNGSGKTTLIGLLTRREWPLRRADGRPPVRLLGRELGDVFELRRQMGIISPDDDRGFIAERCTALDAVLSGFFAARGIWRRQVSAEQQAAARAALERLGVADLATRRTDAMSTGQLRRVLIARALVHQPPLLLLDEPTTGLDLVARRAFLDQLVSLAGTTTILLVTHQVAEILPAIERVALLRGGRLDFDGPKAEALTAPRMSQTFGAPIRVECRDGWYRAAVV